MSRRPQFKLTPTGKLQLAESDVTRQCLDLVRARGWWPIRQHVGLFRTPDGRKISIGETGDPDYAVIKAPSFFLEFKRPGGGKLSDEQRERIARLKHFYDLDTVVVDDLDQLVEWLRQRERSP